MDSMSDLWLFLSYFSYINIVCCQRCAVITCIQLTLENLSFHDTEWRLLAEGHSPALVRLHGTVFMHIWKTKCLPWTLLSVRLSVFCLPHTDTAHGVLLFWFISKLSTHQFSSTLNLSHNTLSYLQHYRFLPAPWHTGCSLEDMMLGCTVPSNWIRSGRISEFLFCSKPIITIMKVTADGTANITKNNTGNTNYHHYYYYYRFLIIWTNGFLYPPDWK